MTPTRATLAQVRWHVVLSSAGAAVLVIIALFGRNQLDFDAYRSIDLSNIYAPTADMSTQFAFRYSPPIALLMAPLAVVPAADVVWFALQLLALWYVGRRWALALVLFPPVGLDLAYGNVNIMIAAAIVAGFRYPMFWAFPVLTKVSPGVGLLWFAVRREWWALGVALITTAGALALAELLLPGSTMAWAGALSSNLGIPQHGALPVPLPLRLVVAAVVVAWGARTDRAWTVPVAVTLAIPVWWPIAFAPLIAILPLWRTQLVTMTGPSRPTLTGSRTPAS